MEEENTELTDNNMRDLWLLVKISPLDVRALVWYVMHKSGMSFEKIGKAFGCSRQNVFLAVDRFEAKLKEEK